MLFLHGSRFFRNKKRQKRKQTSLNSLIQRSVHISWSLLSFCAQLFLKQLFIAKIPLSHNKLTMVTPAQITLTLHCQRNGGSNSHQNTPEKQLLCFSTFPEKCSFNNMELMNLEILTMVNLNPPEFPHSNPHNLTCSLSLTAQFQQVTDRWSVRPSECSAASIQYQPSLGHLTGTRYHILEKKPMAQTYYSIILLIYFKKKHTLQVPSFWPS